MVYTCLLDEKIKFKQADNLIAIGNNLDWKCILFWYQKHTDRHCFVLCDAAFLLF